MPSPVARLPTFSDLANNVASTSHYTTVSSTYRVSPPQQTSSRSDHDAWYSTMHGRGTTAPAPGTSQPSVNPGPPTQSQQAPALARSRSDVNMTSPRVSPPRDRANSLPELTDGEDDEQEHPFDEDDEESDEERHFLRQNLDEQLQERLRRFEEQGTLIIERVATAIIDRINAFSVAPTPAAQPVSNGGQSEQVPSRGLQTPRATSVVQRHRDIREHMARLMNRAGVVDEAVAAAYENRISTGNYEECCTPETFQVALTGQPKRPWNRSAAAVFARSFRTTYGIDPRPGEMGTIMKQALVRIKGMYRKRRKNALPARSSNALNQRNRRASRKETLFQKRLTTCMGHPLLHEHVDFIKSLGRNGMSSDESDHEEANTNVIARTRPPRFYVLRPRWRDSNVGEFLEVIDMVGFVSRRRNGESKSGSFFRTRLHSNGRLKISASKKFVPRLPINVYHPPWLDGRNDIDICIDPHHAPYNFTVDPRILQYIQEDQDYDD